MILRSLIVLVVITTSVEHLPRENELGWLPIFQMEIRRPNPCAENRASGCGFSCGWLCAEQASPSEIRVSTCNRVSASTFKFLIKFASNFAQTFSPAHVPAKIYITCIYVYIISYLPSSQLPSRDFFSSCSCCCPNLLI